MPRGLVIPNIVATVGSTPLVRLGKVIPPGHATVLLKCEFFNPAGSVKDRIGRAMIEAGEQAGLLHEESHIIEPTSGNTGIALAFVAAARGYRLTLVMPETMSHERRALLRALGADLVLTPGNEGMKGAIARAQDLIDRTPEAFAPRQFDNPANPKIHEETTGPEIWTDTGGNVDVILAGVGTGGTITGATRYIRKYKREVKAIAIEPVNSAVISGRAAGGHKVQGIGAGFVPRNLDVSLLSEVQTVTDEEAFHWARRVAREEGILGGISTGANLAVAARLAALPEYRGKTIVTFACSFAERYLSTPLFDLIGKHTLADELARI